MSVNPYSRASWPELTDCWFHRARRGSEASATTARPTYRGDSESAKSAGARGGFAGRPIEGVAPVLLRDAEVVEHHLRAKPSGRDGDRGRAVRRQLVSLGEGQPVHGDLGQVVEHGDPVARRVVVGGAVGHLDEQAAGLVDEQREQVMRRDEVRVDGEPEDAGDRRRGRAPRSACSTAPGPPLSSSPPQMSLTSTSMWPWSLRICSASAFTWRGIEMVDGGRDAGAAEARDELGGLLDRLGAVVVGPGRSRCCDRCTRPSRPLRPAPAAMPRPAPRVAPATTATRPRRACGSGDQRMARVCQASSSSGPPHPTSPSVPHPTGVATRRTLGKSRTSPACVSARPEPSSTPEPGFRRMT